MLTCCIVFLVHCPRWVLPITVKPVKDWDVAWTIEDDSRLLAGVYEYGYGSWEAIKMDPTYALADKILPDGDLKPQVKQLQSRVDNLLRMMSRKILADKMQNVTSRKINSASGKATKKEKNGTSSKSVKSGGKVKDKKKEKGKEKKKKKKDKRRSLPAMHYQANKSPAPIGTALETNVFEYCKEKMRPVKKALKLISKPELSKEKERDCLLKIGARICECLNELNDGSKSKEWRNNLWTFVSEFTEFSGKRLYRMYKLAMENGSLSPRHHSSSSSSHRHENNSHASHKDKSKRLSDSASPSPLKRSRGGDFGFRDSHGYPPPPPPSHAPLMHGSSRQGSSSGPPPMPGGVGSNIGWQPRGPPSYMHPQRTMPFHPHKSMIPPPQYPPYGPYPPPPHVPAMPPHMNNFGPRNRSGASGSGNHQRRMNDRPPHDRGPVRQ